MRPDQLTCRDCVYSEKIQQADLGSDEHECRFNPPKVFFTQNGMVSQYSLVLGSMWCGRGKRKQK